MLGCHVTTDEEKAAISSWKYDGDYAVYNTPPYEEQLRTHRGFANPGNRFFSFTDGSDLIGYINLKEEESEVFLGIGVHPDLCDRGYGRQICRQARDLSHRLYPGKPLCLIVRTWNMRAVRCYEKAGFRIVGEPFRQTTPVGEGTFYRMTAD